MGHLQELPAGTTQTSGHNLKFLIPPLFAEDDTFLRHAQLTDTAFGTPTLQLS